MGLVYLVLDLPDPNAFTRAVAAFFVVVLHAGLPIPVSDQPTYEEVALARDIGTDIQQYNDRLQAENRVWTCKVRGSLLTCLGPYG